MRYIPYYLFAFAVLIACNKDDNGDDGDSEFGCETTISYANDVAPIVQANCTTGEGAGTGCHDAWILEYDGLKAQVESGNIRKVVYEERRMPFQPNTWGIDSLSEENINILMCWIEQGYPEN